MVFSTGAAGGAVSNTAPAGGFGWLLVVMLAAGLGVLFARENRLRRAFESLAMRLLTGCVRPRSRVDVDLQDARTASFGKEGGWPWH